MEEPYAFTIDVSEGRVKITGNIDLKTTPLMVEAVTKAMTVELDLSEVTFLDSTGLYGLIKLRNNRSSLHIVAVSPQVHRVLEVTSLAESILTSDRGARGDIARID